MKLLYFFIGGLSGIIILTVFFIFMLPESKSKYLPILANNVNIRHSPDINSDVISNLKIATRVELLEKQNKVVRYENVDGHWAKIKVHNNLSGWIFDYYLGYPEKFSPYNFKNKVKLVCGLGDYWISYDINEKGKFKYSYMPCQDGNCGPNKEHRKCFSTGEKLIKDTCYGDGKLYRAANLIWLKRNHIPNDEYVFYCENNNICSAELGISCKLY